MKQDNQQNFFDSRTILAMLLVGVTYLAWQSYMKNKYPDIYNPAPTSTTTTVTPPAENKSTEIPAETKAAGVPLPESHLPPEQVVHYQSNDLNFDISSHGMGIRTIEVLKYKNRQGETVELGRPHDDLLPLQTRLLGKVDPLEFKIEQVNPNLFVGRAQVGKVTVTKSMEIIPDKYVIHFKVVASGNDERFVGLTTALTEQITVNPDEGFLASKRPGAGMMVQAQKQELFVDTADSRDREVFSKDLEKTWSKVRIASIGSQYFTQAVLDKSNIMPDAKGVVDHGKKLASILLDYPDLNHAANFELNYIAFVGPKSVNLLRQADEQLAQLVDFGFFSWIGRHILQLLRLFYQLVGNWGIAIVLLTLLVRLVVMPVNIYSYKSMRAMQAIQPQMAALKEKYKNDQAKQQQEIMALMKSHKVNPLGGCLPLLLQFPIFIALYQVLGNSIELYQAPFGLWIHDLSYKDPFYILPVLMGLTMFFQQKLMPNTMDPAQAKMMMFMPLIFTFFMVSVPSGLTLYMLVGALFSVIQQSYFMKPTKTLSSGVKL